MQTSHTCGCCVGQTTFKGKFGASLPPAFSPPLSPHSPQIQNRPCSVLAPGSLGRPQCHVRARETGREHTARSNEGKRCTRTSSGTTGSVADEGEQSWQLNGLEWRLSSIRQPSKDPGGPRNRRISGKEDAQQNSGVDSRKTPQRDPTGDAPT